MGQLESVHIRQSKLQTWKLHQSQKKKKDHSSIIFAKFLFANDLSLIFFNLEKIYSPRRGGETREREKKKDGPGQEGFWMFYSLCAETYFGGDEAVETMDEVLL